MANEDRNLIITFGKHAGKPVRQMPPEYLIWLAGQRGWLREKYPLLYRAVVREALSYLKSVLLDTEPSPSVDGNFKVQTVAEFIESKKSKKCEFI